MAHTYVYTEILYIYICIVCVCVYIYIYTYIYIYESFVLKKESFPIKDVYENKREKERARMRFSENQIQIQ